MHFFVYCVCMVFKCGRGMNPYFGLLPAEVQLLNAAFRHLVEDEPVSAIKPSGSNDSALSGPTIYRRLRYRGYFSPDGTLNRNAMKRAVVEFGWIYRSDWCNEVKEQAARLGDMRRAERVERGEVFLKEYLLVLLLRYLGVTLASQDWYLEHAFPLIEDYLWRCEPAARKMDRNAMRATFTGLLVGVSGRTGKSVEQVLFNLARLMGDPGEFRRITGAETMLQALYYSSLVCEFARDVYPLEMR